MIQDRRAPVAILFSAPGLPCMAITNDEDALETGKTEMPSTFHNGLEFICIVSLTSTHLVQRA